MCQLAKGWLYRAQKAIDVYDRFISAYIALNFLYNNRSEKVERERMVRYLLEVVERNSMDPLVYDIAEYKASPVVDMTPYSTRGKPDVIVSDKKSLFEAIYQVRCNLFHGNKALGDTRDQRLVAQGAGVIIAILTKELRQENRI